MKKLMCLLVGLIGIFFISTPAFAADIYYDTGKLTWEAPVSGGEVVGYYVNYGTVPGVYTYKQDVGKVLTINVKTLPNLTVGLTWYFTVSAYNTAGEGAKSNEVYGKVVWLPKLQNLQLIQ